ncbi:uncharacterized protein LOC142140654 isoform X2 [Mixophyes fleayi]|uniref:uncharacterized protein LOC142140654 isoform X2 n=1 Tax=Mixophyes fleayi TaxID=3061075 RepID=UPI003F4DCECF
MGWTIFLLGRRCVSSWRPEAGLLHSTLCRACTRQLSTDPVVQDCPPPVQKRSPVRIGCASGFWGDTAASVPQLLYGGKLDFLVFDYLSEITMSLLSAAKSKSPSLGFTPDFVHTAMAPYLKDLHKSGVRVISNAGGTNPLACAAALQEIVKKSGLDMKIAVVTGDDLIGQFGWKRNDFDLLAAGSLAGHLIECGAQCTGGIYTDWHLIPDWHNIGFPIVECTSDGKFSVSKPQETGGLISFGTVAEQLVYEIGDPEHYILPDVSCDFSYVSITEVQDDEAVEVLGARGVAPSSSYKVCATYLDGFRATAVCVVGGPRAAEKGRRTAESILRRTRDMFAQLGLEDYSAVNVQIIGAEDSYGPHARGKDLVREAVIWLGVHHKQKKALEIFAREIAPAGTGMAPGLTAIVGGRPRVSPVLKPFFFLYPRKNVTIDIYMNGKHIENFVDDHSFTVDEYISFVQPPTPEVPKDLPTGPYAYRLGELAYTRSGDKGNNANIGVVARHPLYYPYLKRALTSQVVEEYFQHLLQRDQEDEQLVTRYELPGIHALNFFLKNSLGGGGIASLRSDPQGKAFGQMLLDLEITNVPDLKSLID